MNRMTLTHEIPERVKQEGLVEYAESLSDLYARTYDAESRKLKGQFFTPTQVSTYMARLFDVHQGTIRLLDPGAGTGVLTAAFCERLLDSDQTINLTIDAYENDRALSQLLMMSLQACKLQLQGRGHDVKYNVCEQDFILHNEGYFNEKDSSGESAERPLYDFVISNPPYYKLNKESPQSTVMMELVSGQPNIYALFMALSARMVKSEGEMVFITPRSFCSGLYYKRFREWFLNNVQITNIHTFESRKEVFAKDKVLQENVIIKAKKRKETSKHDKVIIATSRNKDFDKLESIAVPLTDVIRHRNGETFIQIPTSPLDVDILHIINSWPTTLKDLGLEISTGPVVPFRTEGYLLPELTESPKSAPLLWMHNMRDMGVAWPAEKNGKASAIRVCDETAPLLLPVKNYVLVKRFSSKEQKRRLYASVLLESEFPYESVGIENHVNYIYRPDGNLSVYETFGIAALLNTTMIDNYFRSLNGNTQVNATDIRSLPFPSIEDVRKIGETVCQSQSRGKVPDLESIVTNILGTELKEIHTKVKDE